ncbi:alpha/beta hydrolase fold-containing protein [Raphidiopsis curvata NIES-932]|nr:alpha/beta hydrolase fold-containing protein [Raphidiopsis curvata NIES-932]
MAKIEIHGVPHAYELTVPTSHPDTLVFIHGWLNSRSYWQPLISRLSLDFQCLSYDLRGFGESQCQSSDQLHNSHEHSPYSTGAYSQDLIALLELLSISRVWLIGHSWGGTIALKTALQLPNLVQGVICINAGGGIYLKEAFERFRATSQKFLKIRPRWLYQLPLIDLFFTRTNVARPLDRHWARQRIMDFIIADPQSAIGTLMSSTTEEEVNSLPHLVSQIKQPVYFLTGADDKVIEPKYVRHLASFHWLFQCVGDNVIEIPNCGHLSMLEQPDAVSKHIISIITG